MKPAKVIVEKVRGFKFKDTVTEYSEMKAILYALGIGVSRDPMNLNDLNFTYERAENFKVLPTFGVVLGISGRLFDGLNSCPGLPEFNPMMLLHGEHKLELFRPFPGKQKLQIKNEITDIADKGKAALLTMQHTIFDENQALLCRNTLVALEIRVLVKILCLLYQKMLLIKDALIMFYHIRLFFIDFQVIQILYMLHLIWPHLEDLIDLFYMDFASLVLLEELFLENFVEMM